MRRSGVAVVSGVAGHRAVGDGDGYGDDGGAVEIEA
jgi:hypothetical protein